MAKHITKSVIEDIAYQIKRVGLIVSAYEQGNVSDEMKMNFGDEKEFDSSGTSTLDWITENLVDIFYEHDPSFDADRFRQQALYRIEI